MPPPPSRKRVYTAADLGPDGGGSSSSSSSYAARQSKAPRYPRSVSAGSYPPSSSASQPYSSQPSSSSSRAVSSSTSYLQSSLSGADRFPFQDAAYIVPDEFDYVDLTQDDGPGREFYGSIDTKIVGVRYYNGIANPGEAVVCKREPNNPYDKNAIRINNVMGAQIGHIPRNVAEKLASYLDDGDIDIQAMLTGEKGYYDCPVRVYVYGTTDRVARVDLEERLKKDRLVKATQLKQTRQENDVLARRTLGLKSGMTSAGLPKGSQSSQERAGPSLEDLTQISQVVQARTGVDFVKSIAIDEDTLSKMPMASQPECLRATLLPYQLQGLAWLRAKENPTFPPRGSSDMVQLWKRDTKGRYVNVATKFMAKEAPGLLSGGILADDMGLGKTLQVISLIMTGTGSGPTLIVAPVSVMSNWEQQINRHVHEDHLPSTLIYHGSARQAFKDKEGSDLSGVDVVITSYGLMSSEAANGGLLRKTKWRRVVLDEGHTIRNARTKVAEAACLLEAESRWVLTGTPIINNIRDLHSLLKFLRITGGLEQSDVFNMVVAKPLADGLPEAELVIQSLMQDICLRRKKDMKFVDLKLPPKTEYKHSIEFWPDEKKKYDALLLEAKGALEAYQRRSSAGQSGRFQSVLERLLRLRQVCNHWTLCRERVADLLKMLDGQTAVPLTDENRKILQEALRLMIESQEECPVCFDTLSDPVITHCKHSFCRACITKVIQLQKKCPMCRTELTEDKLLEPSPEGGSDDEEQEGRDTEKKSSKTEALLSIVNATLKKEGSKVIVFSQWTSFLNVIQHQLAEAGIKYTRIDGSMQAPARDAAMRALDSDPETRVLLASLSVCSVGLNLVAADTVILADSWWAPAIEDQAVDRVHRLGQTRPTTVWRLVMEGTVEERVLDIQVEKRQLVSKAFQEKSGKGKKAKETRMGDIAKLLG